VRDVSKKRTQNSAWGGRLTHPAIFLCAVMGSSKPLFSWRLTGFVGPVQRTKFHDASRAEQAARPDLDVMGYSARL
jgi:hypothetical protein